MEYDMRLLLEEWVRTKACSHISFADWLAIKEVQKLDEIIKDQNKPEGI